MKLSKLLKIGAGICIAVIGLCIFFKDVKLHDIWMNIRQTKWWVIVIVALFSPLSLWLRAIRWNMILPKREGVERKGLFPIVVIAFMINNILPARLGEVARAFLLWKKNRFTAVESIGSLVIERILDSLVFLSFIFCPIFFQRGLEQFFLYGIILAIIFIVSVFSIILYAKYPEFTKKKIVNLCNYIPEKVRGTILKAGRELISNMNWAFSVKKAIAVLIFSYLTIFCYVGMMWFLGIDIQAFGVLGSMFGVAFAAIGAAIPLSPGYVGTLHATLMQGLTMLGVPADRAGALTILYHAIGYLVVTIIGIYFFFSMKISLKEIAKVKEEAGK